MALQQAFSKTSPDQAEKRQQPIPNAPHAKFLQSGTISFKNLCRCQHGNETA